jgi:homoserine dehydrogenase
VLRHVACIEKCGDSWQASVKLVSLAADHPLARVHNENNAVSWTTAAGDVFSVSGKGAGRWPTTQAVVADLLDVYAARVCSNAGCSEVAS